MINLDEISISNLKTRIHKSEKKILEKVDIYYKIYNRSHILTNKKNFSTMSCFLYPDSIEDKLLYVIIFFNTLYNIDDTVGEVFSNPSNKSRLLSNLSSKDVFDNISSVILSALNNDIEAKHIIDFLYTCIKNFKKGMSTFSYERLKSSLIKHINSSLSSNKYTTIEEYIHQRVEVSGMFITIDLIDYVYNFDSKKLYENKIFDELRELVAIIGAISNDIFSFFKEKDSLYNVINAYKFLGIENNEEIAIKKSVKLLNNYYNKYLLLQNELKSGILNNNEKKYLNFLDDIISASYNWQKSTDRYKGVNQIIQELQKTTIIE